MRAPMAAVLLLALTACPALDPMQQQQKYEAYQVNPFYPDDLAMRHPPAGTVQYGAQRPAPVETGLDGDGGSLRELPLPVDAAMLARGRNRYDVYCAVCHGLLGDGESQVALAMSLRKPPSLHAFRDVPDGHLFRVVTTGFGLMPGYATEMTVEERWAVVAYVRALQLSQFATVEQLPPEERERLQKEGR